MERHTQYKDTILTIELPLWGSNGTIEYLKGMTFHSGVEEIPWVVEYKTRAGKTKTRPDYHKQTRRLRFTFSQYQTEHANRFLRDLANTFREGFLKIERSEKNHFKDDWELLKHELGIVDWTADYSDDFRCWSSLQGSISRITELINDLKPVDSNRLSTIVHKKCDGNGMAQWVLNQI